jgi:hypothetical protein
MAITVEQNAEAALAMSDFGIVLELGPDPDAQPRRRAAADPWVGEPLSRRHIEESAA